jgi:hypothetical protein
MRIKIREGTARHHDAPLCHTCRHACIVRGRSLRDEIVECGRLSHPHTRVTFAVVFCTAYVNARHPTIREMEDLAWVLRSDTKKHTIGFVQAKDLAPRHRFVLEDDDL